MGIGKVAVECLRDAVSNRTFLGRVETRQDSQQITEEFTANEVVVNETVVLLAGIGRVGSDRRTQDFKTGPLSGRAIDPHVKVAVNDAAGPEVPIDLQKKVLRVRFQQDAPFTDDPGPALENGDHD